MTQMYRNSTPDPARKADELEALLVGILGVALVMVAIGVAYYLISKAAPPGIGGASTSNVHTGLWIGGIFGPFFFIYGAVGVLRGRIGVGSGPWYAKASTVLNGAGAFVASVSTALGGVLFMVTAAISLIPELTSFIHELAILLSGFVSILLGWLCGVIVRELGY
jgi:hypothetical protein